MGINVLPEVDIEQVVRGRVKNAVAGSNDGVSNSEVDVGEMSFDTMIKRMKDQESMGHQMSDRGRAPVTDDGSPEGRTINDHHDKDPPQMPKSQDESGNVCCVALPGLIGSMNATSKEAAG